MLNNLSLITAQVIKSFSRIFTSATRGSVLSVVREFATAASAALAALEVIASACATHAMEVSLSEALVEAVSAATQLRGAEWFNDSEVT